MDKSVLELNNEQIDQKLATLDSTINFVEEIHNELQAVRQLKSTPKHTLFRLASLLQVAVNQLNNMLYLVTSMEMLQEQDKLANQQAVNDVVGIIEKDFDKVSVRELLG